MKILIILAVVLPPVCMQAQKIVLDQVQPISKKRIVVTSALPIFQMKVITASAMAQIKDADTLLSIGYYFMRMGPATTDKARDTTTFKSIILLSSGEKITGTYVSTTSMPGMDIIEYRFIKSDLMKISQESATAYSVDQYAGAGEYALDKSYADNFRKICATLLKRIN